MMPEPIVNKLMVQNIAMMDGLDRDINQNLYKLKSNRLFDSSIYWYTHRG